jgi:hypothetical protein
MNTIFWLSIFGLVYGYFMFFASIIGVWLVLTKKSGTLQEQLVMRHLYNTENIHHCLRWKELLAAIICTIIVITI